MLGSNSLAHLVEKIGFFEKVRFELAAGIVLPFIGGKSIKSS